MKAPTPAEGEDREKNDAQATGLPRRSHRRQTRQESEDRAWDDFAG